MAVKIYFSLHSENLYNFDILDIFPIGVLEGSISAAF